jgi:hypothetical protein
LGPLGTATTNRPIVPHPGDYDDGEIGGMIGKVNRRTYPSTALTTTNPTCCSDANPGSRVGNPETNRLSYGTAISSVVMRITLHSDAFQELMRVLNLSRPCRSSSG